MALAAVDVETPDSWHWVMPPLGLWSSGPQAPPLICLVRTQCAPSGKRGCADCAQRPTPRHPSRPRPTQANSDRHLMSDAFSVALLSDRINCASALRSAVFPGREGSLLTMVCTVQTNRKQFRATGRRRGHTARRMQLRTHGELGPARMRHSMHGAWPARRQTHEKLRRQRRRPRIGPQAPLLRRRARFGSGHGCSRLAARAGVRARAAPHLWRTAKRQLTSTKREQGASGCWRGGAAGGRAGGGRAGRGGVGGGGTGAPVRADRARSSAFAACGGEAVRLVLPVSGVPDTLFPPFVPAV